ncbi:helix-turn-helix domain-containing protein [Luteitalea pratensis]|uniref:helix-turn-helix transcriptional regulator n=1 Tax=Luteitalea pratensis TaxID=1855912 RepID=UPI000D72E17C
MSEAEAAQYLGLSRAWLKKARTARFRAAIDGPPFVKAGARRVVYRRRDLEDWVQAHVSRQPETTGLPEVRPSPSHP